MDYQNSFEVERYLSRFQQILDNMSYQMTSVSMTNNITKNFIRTMIPHHQAAIYMCQNLLQYTTYQPLIKIAYDIISTQTKGIKEMQEILRTTVDYSNTTRDVNRYLDRYYEITYYMIQRMQNSLQSSNINLNFVSEMIPHHEGAIAMCRNLLQYPIDPRLRRIANSIIEEQSRGVQQLKQIQKNLTSY